MTGRVFTFSTTTVIGLVVVKVNTCTVVVKADIDTANTCYLVQSMGHAFDAAAAGHAVNVNDGGLQAHVGFLGW